MKKLLYDSRNQNLHMDRAKKDSMKTVKLTVNTNLAYSATPRLIHRYAHGYPYVPQFWGLWDIKYAAGGLGGGTRRGYGFISHNTGFALNADFYYTVDATYVSIYFLFNSVTGLSPKPNTAGTTATFTGYLFANDRSNQDYTS